MNTSHLRPQALSLMAALVVQYLLGMYVDLFVSFPEGADEGQIWQFAWSQPALAAHIILAVLILLGAIALCIRAARTRNRIWIWSSLVGLLALFAAGFSGGRFIPTQDDLYSYSMAVAFILAFASYAWALYATRASMSVE